MSLVKAIHRLTRFPTMPGLLLGSILWPVSIPLHACDNGSAGSPAPQTLRHQARRLSAGTNLASATTSATANASASARASSSAHSSERRGGCTAESNASARARAGDQYQEDHDSDRQSSADGDCRASSKSSASAGPDRQGDDGGD